MQTINNKKYVKPWGFMLTINFLISKPEIKLADALVEKQLREKGMTPI